MVSSSVVLGIDAALPELGRHVRFHVLEFLDLGIEIATATLQIVDMEPAAAQELAKLLHTGTIYLVKVEQLLDLRQRKTQTLAAQDPAKPGAIADAIEPRQPLAARLDQPLILVEADGARRDGELARQFGDAIDALRVALCLGSCGSGDGHGEIVIVDVYVNVNQSLRQRMEVLTSEPY